MHIAMIGSGYVGLVSGACLADAGHEVVSVDQDVTRIAALEQGDIPIFEPGLDRLVAENVDSGRLRFTTDLPQAVKAADVVFIAVGTPSRRGDGHADLSYVYAAAAQIARALNGFTVVAMKSTVPVGTGDEVERIIREANPEADAIVVSNPEFLREGAAIEDFQHPDRIVIGLEDERARAAMTAVYRPLGTAAPLLFTGRRSAELIKYAGNAFLAMKVTFINEIADLCEKTGANVEDVARGMGLDGRIGPKFLAPGPGYGGSCLPKDTLALVKTGQQHATPLRLVEATVAANDERKQSMSRRIIAALGGTARGKTIALLGLTYKANTDDMRDAPSIAIVLGLKDAGAVVRAYDPEGMESARLVIEGIDHYAADPYDAATGAHCLVVVTEWSAFRALDLPRLRGLMAEPRIVDLRNMLRGSDVEAAGFSYSGIGRPRSAPSTAASSEAAE